MFCKYCCFGVITFQFPELWRGSSRVEMELRFSRHLKVRRERVQTATNADKSPIYTFYSFLFQTRLLKCFPKSWGSSRGACLSPTWYSASFTHFLFHLPDSWNCVFISRCHRVCCCRMGKRWRVLRGTIMCKCVCTSLRWCSLLLLLISAPSSPTDTSTRCRTGGGRTRWWVTTTPWLKYAGLMTDSLRHPGIPPLK